MHSVSSFVHTHQGTQPPQTTQGRIHRLWRRYWSGWGLPLVAVGWISLFFLHRTAFAYGGLGMVRSPFFLGVVLAIGVGLPLCSREMKRGKRFQGMVGMLMGYTLGAASIVMLFTRILSPEALLKM
jgi:hypothetical protein